MKLDDPFVQDIISRESSNYDVQVIADTKNGEDRLITVQLRYPRFIHCFRDDTEFLSQINDEFPQWRKYDEIVSLGAKVAQYDDGDISFVLPNHCIRKSADKLVTYKSNKFELAVTPEHRMYSLRRTTNNEFLPKIDLAKDWVGSFSGQRRIPQAGNLVNTVRTNNISPDEAALIAFYVADGHCPLTGNTVQFHFKKVRKTNRVKELLANLGIEYSESAYGDNTVIRFNKPNWVNDCYTAEGEKKYPDVIWNISKEAFASFKQATLESDGNVTNEDINTSSEVVAEQTQVLASLNSVAMNIRKYKGGIYKQVYQKSNYVSFRSDRDTFTEEEYEGEVVCFSVPSTLLFVRLNGFAYVSGNCEMMTHKRFSRNASSSRARPLSKEIERVKSNPAIPIYWGKNTSGMQAKRELVAKAGLKPISETLKDSWIYSLNSTIKNIKYMESICEANANGSLHKQTVNRLLEPYQLMEAVFTGNIESFNAFFDLRIHPDAQPEIIKLAYMIYEAINQSEPKEHVYHLPYITDEDLTNMRDTGFNIKAIQKVSAARCARVSYKLFDGSTSIEKDLDLASKLLDQDFPHASPAEHPAIACKGKHANFSGFMNYRTQLGL